VVKHLPSIKLQQLTVLPNRGLRLTLRLTSLDEIERWLLSWGTHAKVLAPASLQSRLKNTATQIATQY
jgi:predicted DNA-binding transcriptional regulator YafY